MSREELFKAINIGNLEKVKHLVENDPNIKETELIKGVCFRNYQSLLNR